MGLDSVELLVAFEKRFNIVIPDTEAEWIDTVAKAADCICRHLRIPAEAGRSGVFSVLERLVQCLSQQQPLATILTTDSTAATRLETMWPAGAVRESLGQLRGCLALRVPTVAERPKPRTGWAAWLLGPSSVPDWTSNTVADLADWIIALNHEQLLPVVTTLYEVQRVMVSITSTASGMAVDEIRLTNSFTNDLGIS